MNYSKAIEIYTGRKIDFINDIILEDDGFGNISIAQWNITDKPRPTMELLDALGYKAELIIEQEYIIDYSKKTMQEILYQGNYDIFGNDIATIIQNAKNMIKDIKNGDWDWYYIK